MTNKTDLTWEEVITMAKMVANQVVMNLGSLDVIRIYGVPRGGISAALLVLREIVLLRKLPIMVEDPNVADVIIDDIIDSGKTKAKFANKVFFALVDKQNSYDKNMGWVVFPWERMQNEGDGPVENVRRILEYIGEDPEREGLKETPQRVIKSYEKLFGGYKQNPRDIIKVFEEPCDEMVLVKNIEFYSTCEHHLLPFYGFAHVAYIPKDGKVIGVSKLARLVEVFSRRAQIQERICQQVTEALMDIVQPLGAACVLEAKHMCMVCRGIEKQNSKMVTSSLRGVFLEKSEVRAEFMSMIGRF